MRWFGCCVTRCGSVNHFSVMTSNTVRPHQTREHFEESSAAIAMMVETPELRTSGGHQSASRAGLGPDVTPHCLRHTAACWLAMDKIPIDQTADLLACDPATLGRVYRHFDPDYLKEAVDALDAML